MAYGVKKFSNLTLLWKSAQTVILTTLAFEVARMDLPTTVDEWKARAPQIGVTLGLAIFRALQNAWKNRTMPGNPFYNTGAYWMALLIIPALFTGCVGMTPSLAGKSTLDREYRWTTETDETVYNVHAKLPAGVDISTVDKVAMSGGPDGSWSLGVGADAAADTTVQAASLVEVNAAQMQALTGLIQVLASVLPSIVPVHAPTTSPTTAPALPFAIPNDIAGWAQLLRDHPEIINIVQGLGR